MIASLSAALILGWLGLLIVGWDLYRADRLSGYPSRWIAAAARIAMTTAILGAAHLMLLAAAGGMG